MRILIFLLLSAFAIQSSAGDRKYPIYQIPENLLKDANVVCRLEEEQFQIVSLKEAIFKRKIVLTILNENGDRFANMALVYSSLSKITRFEGVLYNANGEQIKTLRSKEIIDRSYVDDNSLMEDTRIKLFDFNHRTYPYTVEFETEQKTYNTYGIPDWTPQTREYYSVQKSTYTFIAPPDYVVRYKAVNYKNAPIVSANDRSSSYYWEIENLPAIIKPFASPKWADISVNVQFSPSQFEMQGYKGNANSWEDFGKFSWSLNAGRDVLPPAITEKVKQLTSNLTDDREKVEALYDFLQKNTRYISIQLGIGGFQPFEASYVAQKGYGDCKALSNYMFSLLKAAGIKSHYSLIYGGKDLSNYNLMEDFPSDAFNHIVLCVPLAQDSMWLECTSQTNPAGYLGGFTGNRKALLITENGGRLVSTPRYGVNENNALRKINGVLSPDGNLEIKVQALYRNIEQDRLNSVLNHSSKDKVHEFLQSEYDDLGTYTINSFDHTIKKGKHPVIEETLDISAFKYGTISGKRIFILPNVMNRQGMRITLDTARKLDYVFESQFSNEDIIQIEIPDGYQLESTFPDIHIKSKLGNYSATVKVEGKNIIYRRVSEQFGGRYTAKEGEAIVKYYNDIYKADRAKLVFVKKAG